MKRILVGTACLLLAAATPQPADAKLKIFACFPAWEALAKEIGGQEVEVFAAAKPLENPDQVTVAPELVASLKSADLLVCSGSDYESTWLRPALERAQNPKLADGQPGQFFAADFVRVIDDDHHIHKGPTKAHAHMHPGGNPHFQGDPYRIRAIGGQLGKRLIELDRANAASYSENTKRFVREIGEVAKELEKKAAALQGINIVSQHENSVYLLHWLKIRSAGVLEPAVGVPPGPGDLARIVELVPRENVKFILYAAYEDPRPSKYVAERTGIPMVKLPFTVGGTDGAGPTYADFFRDTVERLLDGLAGRERS